MVQDGRGPAILERRGEIQRSEVSDWMSELKPCPFCGNNVRLEDMEFDDFAGNFFTNTMLVIECEKCGISMKKYPKRGYGTTDEQKKDLINSWNRRTEVNYD